VPKAEGLDQSVVLKVDLTVEVLCLEDEHARRADDDVIDVAPAVPVWKVVHNGPLTPKTLERASRLPLAGRTFPPAFDPRTEGKHCAYRKAGVELEEPRLQPRRHERQSRERHCYQR
jgi:hypothetical protein